MRPRITRDTDAERAGEDAIHARVGGEDGAPRFEPLTQLGLEMAGDRDHDRGGLEVGEVVDELELLFWSERGLQDDHLVRFPGAGAGLGRADRLDRRSQPPGCRQEPLHEQKFVGYDEQMAWHGCRIAG
jgi:hypothetical protein